MVKVELVARKGKGLDDGAAKVTLRATTRPERDLLRRVGELAAQPRRLQVLMLLGQLLVDGKADEVVEAIREHYPALTRGRDQCERRPPSVGP